MPLPQQKPYRRFRASRSSTLHASRSAARRRGTLDKQSLFGWPTRRVVGDAAISTGGTYWLGTLPCSETNPLPFSHLVATTEWPTVPQSALLCHLETA
jgi:hypothetical protein